MIEFFDTHAHLDYPDFESDLNQVLERASAAGIAKVISIGTDLASSTRAVRLAETYATVFAAVGWHPSHASEAPAELPGEFQELARHSKVVAIGETGLDYSHLPNAPGGALATNAALKEKQLRLFRQQLELAAEVQLNCVIHQRAAFEETLKELAPWRGRVRGVFHCFVNGPADVARVLELRSMVSFTGIVTFKNAAEVRAAVAAAPLGSFMLETDSPFLAPVPFRGKRCEPAHVLEIAKAVAAVKQCSLEQLSGATSQAAWEFFPKLRVETGLTGAGIRQERTGITRAGI